MTVQSWERLHRNERHQLKYPSEHVVRWLAGLPGTGVMALDIGCGAGRHTRLLRDFGYRAIGVDTSSPYGVVGDMRDLPSADNWFDVALAFGVFYYGTHEDHLKAISEMHRVLKPGGHGLVVTRTFRDSRARNEMVGDYWTRSIVEGDEAGMLMNFLARNDVTNMYAIHGGFSRVDVNLTETTRDNQHWVDSDWLIRLVK